MENLEFGKLNTLYLGALLYKKDGWGEEGMLIMPLTLSVPIVPCGTKCYNKLNIWLLCFTFGQQNDL